ncbi:MAG: bifunctional enoyl-CoA hydratase/phosphate acetyltransferase [Roseibium sp.]|uniref:bifunctional enoyl-CoA hydratase/phosphate acetyltransferase n=1 Tax=Roseibium sp. TaxID=1936156 RepID=UPI001B11EAD9|nr:bifunctional enoyl-CoA hydratase/phosphate acetyltransferase [Roseibium sp.]MBO6890375.1 bifunctional enoyl-CoA hydratase/phosphate acetyltransferase [Roseibium sp.]MBO6929184.1 bifunctional enoyl-CoA hydratase/phosphate acetyltransferase [Roseibium sp.]
MATNKTFDQISVGDTAEIVRECSSNDLLVFAHASGNHNPIHLPDTDWTGDGVVDKPVAPAMWLGGLASAVLGNILPGPGTVYRSQSFKFLGGAAVGDKLHVRVTAKEKKAGNVVVFDLSVKRNGEQTLVEGVAEVVAPTETIEFDSSNLPAVLVQRHRHFNRMIELTKTLPSLPTAVIAPDDPNSLEGALMAKEEGLIHPILIGARDRIEAAAKELGEDISSCDLIDVEDEMEAAGRGVQMVHEGKVKAVMKGHLHTDHLLHHVVKRDGGLRTRRRISHVFVMDIPGRKTPVLISDAAINISPDLNTKVDITQNAIDAACALGLETPRVGILSAIETVNPAIPSSLDAAVLSKMAERGQITGAVVDGPLAMDNAIDVQAARTKGITSLVAGHAEVLIVPNLESGNMLAKELTFIAHAEAAGLVIGAKVPVMLTSRADDGRARLASCALALLYTHWQSEGTPAGILDRGEL